MRGMRVATVALGAVVSVVALSGQTPEFDVLIRNGQVLDGTGAAAINADVGIRGDLEMADVVMPGFGLPRVGAAHRIALELVGEDRGANDPLERGGADEPLSRRRHHHAHAVARLRRQPGELEGLIRGDSAAHAKKDPGHDWMLRRGGRTNGRLRCTREPRAKARA